ncbi:hypothetical protein, partial [Frankia tisae]|uniref:hypothetical protein n=1 Tax=Frankia tisae TaxID=2950104 RepID=UPI0021BF670A
NAVELGDSRKFDCWRSGVAGGGVRVAFDEVTVVAGSFDDAWAGAVADGVFPAPDVAVDAGGGFRVLLRGKNPPAR